MTIDLLMEIMAEFMQKMVLTLSPVPGAMVYISGGVANYLSSFFKKKEKFFWDRFVDHGQMRGLLEQA